jgi:hypothetical protein
MPPMMKTTISKAEYSVSPQSKMTFTTSNPIINYSPHSTSLNKTQAINQNHSNCQNDKRLGLIKLKVHEFTMSKMEAELSLLLKIYLNEDNE